MEVKHDNDLVTINYQGTFKTDAELGELVKQQGMNPECNKLVWDYHVHDNKTCIVDGKEVSNYGKCTYKGKTFEGEIKYIHDKLYVGGEFVK